jgi:hypothetical protein
MKGSGDLKSELTAETRSRGENQEPTTEARRHGEGSGDRVIARDRVIGLNADSDQDVMVEHTNDRCHPERAGAHAGAPNTRVFRVVGWSHATASRRIPAMFVAGHADSGSSYQTANLTAESQSRGEESESVNFCDFPISRFSDAPITRSPSALALIARVACILLATFREIFDESAYDRFLLQTNSARSIASYRAFARERDASMQRKPRCC